MKDVKIVEVLCGHGENDLLRDGASTLTDVVNAAANVLDAVCLHDVIVVRGDDGRYYVGEFSFDFVEVDEAEARRVAEDFGCGDEDEEV